MDLKVSTRILQVHALDGESAVQRIACVGTTATILKYATITAAATAAIKELPYNATKWITNKDGS